MTVSRPNRLIPRLNDDIVRFGRVRLALHVLGTSDDHRTYWLIWGWQDDSSGWACRSAKTGWLCIPGGDR